MAKIKVDHEKCIGCGACSSLCPNVFEVKEDGKSHIISEDCKDCNCDDAINSCPVRAISSDDN